MNSIAEERTAADPVDPPMVVELAGGEEEAAVDGEDEVAITEAGDGMAATVDDAIAEAAGAVAEEVATQAAMKVNEKAYELIDADNKDGVAWDQVLAPVTQQMRDRIPGHELLMLPDQSRLVLHKKFEFGQELVSAATGMDINTPDVYSVRSTDNKVTYFEIRQRRAPFSITSRVKDWSKSFFVTKVLGCTKCFKSDYAWDVKDLRTGDIVAVIEAPPAHDDDCCGVVCTQCAHFCCFPLCVCRSMRTATWTTTVGSNPRVLAKVQKQPLYNPCCCTGDDCLGGDCMNLRVEVTFPDSAGTLDPVYLYKDKCECFRDPVNICADACCDDLEGSEMVIVDQTVINYKPGRGSCTPNRHIGEPSNFLGRVIGPGWQNEYKPTNGHSNVQGRYTPLSTTPDDPDSYEEAAKLALKEAFVNSRSFLIEVPLDAAEQKAGLIAATILYNTVWEPTVTESGPGACSCLLPTPTGGAIPEGRWRDGLCEWFKFGVCHPMCCLGTFCHPILAGQVMTRMSRSLLGGPGQRPFASYTCKIIAFITIVLVVLEFAMRYFIPTGQVYFLTTNLSTLYYFPVDTNGVSVGTIVFNVVGGLFMLCMTIAICRTRAAMRAKYSIPAKCFGPLEDLCCASCCACCTVQQMARHTHDYATYDVKCCSIDCLNNRGEQRYLPEIDPV